MSQEFKKYRRKQIALLRPYVPGESMDRISVTAADKDAGSPKEGDMIARNPVNADDQWLVAAAYFSVNFEPIEGLRPEGLQPEGLRPEGLQPEGMLTHTSIDYIRAEPDCDGKKFTLGCHGPVGRPPRAGQTLVPRLPGDARAREEEHPAQGMEGRHLSGVREFQDDPRASPAISRKHSGVIPRNPREPTDGQDD